MKQILGLLLIITGFISCSDSTKTNPSKPDNSEPIQETNTLDTAIAPMGDNKTPKMKSVSVFPVGTFKTYPEIVRSLFGEGSSKEEVRTVMGKPELVEPIKECCESWYYGNTEIQFKYGYVHYIVNASQCKKFVEMRDLLISNDPIEKKFGQHLLEGASKYVNYK